LLSKSAFSSPVAFVGNLRTQLLKPCPQSPRKLHPGQTFSMRATICVSLGSKTGIVKTGLKHVGAQQLLKPPVASPGAQQKGCHAETYLSSWLGPNVLSYCVQQKQAWKHRQSCIVCPNSVPALDITDISWGFNTQQQHRMVHLKGRTSSIKGRVPSSG